MPSIMIPVVMDEPERTRTLHSAGVVAKVGVGAMYIPLVSIMATQPVTACLKMAHLLTDGDVIWQIRQGAELTQPDWAPPDETAIAAYDNESVQITGGRVLVSGLCATTTNAGASTKILSKDVLGDFGMVEGVPLTLCARRVNGTGGIVSASIVWCEYVR